MPEQPPDPRNYDMRIPPPDLSRQRVPDEPHSGENENDSDTAKDTGVVRGDGKSQSRRNRK